MTVSLARRLLEFNAAERTCEEDEWRRTRSATLERLVERGQAALVEVPERGRVAVFQSDPSILALRPDERVRIAAAGDHGAWTPFVKLPVERLTEAEVVDFPDAQTIQLGRDLAAGSYWLLPHEPLLEIRDAIDRHVQFWNPWIGAGNAICLSDPGTPPPLTDLLRAEATGGPSNSITNDALEARLVQLDGPSGATLIQGPPGSGKTRLLGRLIGAWTSQGLSVLATAFTNRALDEVLGQACAAGSRSVRRLGRQDVRRDHPAIRESRTLEPEPGSCLGATLFKVNTAIDPASVRPAFDVVVVDEASQVWLGMLLAAAFAARRLVLVGDPLQLPPLVHQSRTAIPPSIREAGIDRSALEYLMLRTESWFLAQTYRLNEEICRLSSDAFYERRLTSHPIAANRGWGEPAVEFLEAAETGGPAGSHASRAEAAAVRETLESIEARHGPWLAAQPESGREPRYLVSCFYRAQVRAVHSELAASSLPRHTWRVDTVERNQSRSCAVGVLSLGIQAPPPDGSSEREFFESPNRWNVALTRARFKVVVAGASAALLPARLSQAWPADRSDRGQVGESARPGR